jgi:predicted metal-dependent phosphoesterase TrpH
VPATSGFAPAALAGRVRLNERLTNLCLRRRERFRDFVRLLRADGHPLDDGHVSAIEAATASLGRRHVANLLVRTGTTRTYGEAWGRFVAPLSRRVTPKLKIPFGEATELLRAAGGVAVLAHPSNDLSETDFARMKKAGLDGVEVKFPAAAVARTLALVAIATRFGLLTTGGSDCHGPGGRPVGSVGATAEELRAVCDATVGETAPAAPAGATGGRPVSLP